MFKHICTTIADLRRRFPFSEVNPKDFTQEVPYLNDVNEAVRLHQRPKDFFTSGYYLRTYNRADYQGCPGPLRLFTWRYMRALRKRGLPFYVHTCYRSSEQQRQLFDKGHSKLRSGAHQRSAAVDIVSAIDHWEIPEALWKYVGTLGESVARDTFLGYTYNSQNGLNRKPLKIEWGGRWDFFDPCHFQLSDWEERPIVEPLEPIRMSPYSDQMRFG